MPQVLKIRGVSTQKKSATTKELDQDLTACSRREEGGHRSGGKPAEPVHCTLHSGDCTGLEESQEKGKLEPGRVLPVPVTLPLPGSRETSVR